jgi:hypothetical protein
MRYQVVGPDVAVLDLLARANDLAAAAVVAIERGDEAGLTDLLDQRGRIVEAAIAAWREVAAAAPAPELVARVAAGVQVSVRLGHEARLVATRVRDEVAAELSSLDARQAASQEYQQSSVQRAINVVL